MPGRSNEETSVIFLIWDCWAVFKMRSDELPPTADSLAVRCRAKLDFGNHCGISRITALHHHRTKTLDQKSNIVFYKILYVFILKS